MIPSANGIQRQLLPGTLLQLASAPESGLWTLIACSVRSFPPGNWHDVEALLLNHAAGLVTVNLEASMFLARWNVIIRP